MSIVGTSTWSMATAYPLQRKTFYANGRYWVFYTNGTNLVYKTSTDGITWSASTTVRVCAYGEFFSIWFDGTYVHYAYAAGSIKYKRGIPESEGTITWSADEQTVATTYNNAYYPFISVDTSGYVWIGYIDSSGGYHPYVIKSGNNDGTWGSTPEGFPYLLSATTGSFCVEVIPLTAGKMLAIYVKLETPVKAKRWTGSEWGAEISVTSNIKDDYAFSAVAENDDVHLVFLKVTSNDIVYAKYIYTSNLWGTEVTVQASVTEDSYPTLSINIVNNYLYCFWAGSPTADHVYYKKSVAGTWDADPTDWINESVDLLTSYQELTSFYKDFNYKIGLVYMTKKTSLYNVKFEYLTVLEDLTTYTAYNRHKFWGIAEHPYNLEWTSLLLDSILCKNESCYFFKYSDIPFSNTTEINFDIKLISAEPDAYGYVIVLSDLEGTLDSISLAGNYIAVYFVGSADPEEPQYLAFNTYTFSGETWYELDWDCSLDTWYYCNLTYDSINKDAILKIYSDLERTVLITTLIVPYSLDFNFSWIYAANTWFTNPNDNKLSVQKVANIIILSK